MNWQDKAFHATKGSQLGAIIACILDRDIPAPCFHGKASVTSDCFIMCNFTGSDGRGHSGAFVGSLSDLINNAQGLARHLKLDDIDRKEFADKMSDWIGNDYSGRAQHLLRNAIIL